MKVGHHTLDDADKGDEPDAMRSPKVGPEDAGAQYSHAESIIRQPAPNNTGLPIVKIRGDKEKLLIGAVEIRVCSNEHFKNDMELAP